MTIEAHGLATAEPIEKTKSSISTYRPEIDGLRAIAVIAVLCSHWIPGFAYPVNWGLAGVYLFFTISGYVITRGLHKELSTKGRIDLTRFFKHRAIRIWPAYFLTILFVYFVWPGFKDGEIIWHSLFLSNFLFSTRDAFLFPIHFWSLSVEQQFYLVWPFMLLLFHRRLWAVCLAMIIFSPVARWYYSEELHKSVAPLFSLASNLDCLAAGSLLAYLERTCSERIVSYISNTAALISCAILACIISNNTHGIYFYDTIFLATAFAGLSFFVISTASKWSYLFRWLTSYPMRKTGTISYGVYLFHLIIGMYVSSTLTGIASPLLIAIVSAAATFIIASLSWRLIEKPLLSLKDKI